MITLRVDALWDFNKKITYMMLGGFVFTYGVAVAFIIVAVVDMRGAYNPISSVLQVLTGVQGWCSSSHP